jgi:acyl carrier protein
MIPKKNMKETGLHLDESEVITRMMFVLHQFKLFDLATLNWQKPFSTQGIDSLESTAIITSVEHEFHTIFEDNVFDSFNNIDDVKRHIVNDHNAF